MSAAGEEEPMETTSTAGGWTQPEVAARALLSTGSGGMGFTRSADAAGGLVMHGFLSHLHSNAKVAAGQNLVVL